MPRKRTARAGAPASPAPDLRRSERGARQMVRFGERRRMSRPPCSVLPTQAFLCSFDPLRLGVPARLDGHDWSWRALRGTALALSLAKAGPTRDIRGSGGGL